MLYEGGSNGLRWEHDEFRTADALADTVILAVLWIGKLALQVGSPRPHPYPWQSSRNPNPARPC